MISDHRIDHGREFDWGMASADYARYRDIYPPAFYEKLLELGLCVQGQDVLDLGTGTGVLPRNLYQYGAHFTGSDLSENQIAEAKRMSEGMNIAYVASPAEQLEFPDEAFDVITACQCWHYFQPAVLLPRLARMLRPGGRLAILFMNWLPRECEIARRSEELVLRYNPSWTGADTQRQAIPAPEEAAGLFDVEASVQFDVEVPFTREGWNGRMLSCRGIGASLDRETAENFSREHMALLEKTVPERFGILHEIEMLVLKVRK